MFPLRLDVDFTFRSAVLLRSQTLLFPIEHCGLELQLAVANYRSNPSVLNPW